MEQIITSLLDNDTYKFTQQQAVLYRYPNAWATYQFIDRGHADWPASIVEKLYEQVWEMSDLAISEKELVFLYGTRLFTDGYLGFLKGFHFDPNDVEISGGGSMPLSIKIVGPWFSSILWEVPLMALVSELYHESSGVDVATSASDYRKIDTFNRHGIHFADFGTRRRFSLANHDRVVGLMTEHADHFLGTSNTMLAKRYGIKPIGTMAHEWIMFHAAAYGYRRANEMALERWADIYNGKLGIALPDTFTTETFLDSFDDRYARLYDGTRQDSGDPIAYANKLIAHYQDLGIDSKSKTIVFSDSLDAGRIAEIHGHCDGKIVDRYGIGTNLTNDVGVTPLNMVIKMTAADSTGKGTWIPTVKLSDDIGKHTGNPEEIKRCKAELKI